MDKKHILWWILFAGITLSECASKRKIFRRKRSTGYRQPPDRTYGSNYHPKPQRSESYDSRSHGDGYHPKGQKSGYDSGYHNNDDSYHSSYGARGPSRYSRPDNHDYGDSRYNGYSDGHKGGFGEDRKYSGSAGYDDHYPAKHDSYSDTHSDRGYDSYPASDSYGTDRKSHEYPVQKYEPRTYEPSGGYKEYDGYDSGYGDQGYGDKHDKGGYPDHYDPSPSHGSYKPHPDDQYEPRDTYHNSEPGYHSSSGGYGKSTGPSGGYGKNDYGDVHKYDEPDYQSYGKHDDGEGYGSYGDAGDSYSKPDYDYKSDQHYDRPGYKSEQDSHYDRPGYKSEQDYDRPAYKSEQEYDRPDYDLSAGNYAKQGHYDGGYNDLDYHGDHGYHDDHGFHGNDHHGGSHHGGYDKGNILMRKFNIISRG